MNNDLPFKTWKYEEQTKIKHEVFADYFDKWVKILGKAHPLNYFDCFGGIGAYKENGEIYFGSPILAAELIKKNETNLQRDVCMVIIDKDKKNFENIDKILKYKNLDIKPEYINKDFDEAINKILDDNPDLAPSFFLVDPFGFKIKLSTLKRMLEIPRSEVLLNFMYNGINRNLGVPDADKVLIDLFGTTQWKKLKDIENSREREKKIIELYRTKLKKFCKFVYPFRLCFPKMNRTYYYLIHLTNHCKGCEIMKGSFAKFNFGRVEYRGRNQYQMTFFDYDHIKIKEIKKYLLSIYKGSPKTFLDIIKEQIDETPYLVKHIRQSIKTLDEEGKVNIDRKVKYTKTGKLKTSLEDLDRVSF